jgi:hypothetical protein
MKKSLWILTIAALLWALPAAADETVRNFSKQIPTDGIDKVDLDFSVGEVVVEAWSNDDLQLDVRLDCHHGRGSCREAAQKVRLVYSTDGGKLHIEMKNWPKLSGHGLEAHINVRMPRQLPLDAGLGVGEMHLAGFTGDVKANVGVGELSLRLPASAVASVRADTGVGESSLIAGGRHYESSGLFTKELRWTQGTGAAKVWADCGVGEINVRLE